MGLEVRICSSKAEQGPLLVPGEWQTRVRQQLVRGQIARLAPIEDGLGDVRGEIAEADEPREIGWAHAARLTSAANDTPSLSTSVALNRRALISSLISRASGLAVANGSTPSISILISRPERRSPIGTERIWVSSVALDKGVAAIPSSMPSRVGRKWISIRLTPTSVRSIRVVSKARCRVAGNSDQLFPISLARAISRRCADGSASRIAW